MVNLSCPGHIVEGLLYSILHGLNSYPGLRGRGKLRNSKPQRSVVHSTSASSGRENWITEDSERAFPELRPEHSQAGQQSTGAVDLENEVSLGALLGLVTAMGCWVWVFVFLEQ